MINHANDHAQGAVQTQPVYSVMSGSRYYKNSYETPDHTKHSWQPFLLGGPPLGRAADAQFGRVPKRAENSTGKNRGPPWRVVALNFLVFFEKRKARGMLFKLGGVLFRRLFVPPEFIQGQRPVGGAFGEWNFPLNQWTKFPMGRIYQGFYAKEGNSTR